MNCWNELAIFKVSFACCGCSVLSLKIFLRGSCASPRKPSFTTSLRAPKVEKCPLSLHPSLIQASCITAWLSTVTFQFFDAGGKDRGIPWRMLARKVDFDPLSLTYKKPVATGLLLIPFSLATAAESTGMAASMATGSPTPCRVTTGAFLLEIHFDKAGWIGIFRRPPFSFMIPTKPQIPLLPSVAPVGSSPPGLLQGRGFYQSFRPLPPQKKSHEF